jgi:DNA-directed RNA polymerase specialized sigma24 family protein
MDRHLNAIRRCIGFMLHGNGATEDLTQEVALKARRYLSAFWEESSFRAWLTRVAINEVRHFQRREFRTPSLREPSSPYVLVSRDESPFEHFARLQKNEGGSRTRQLTSCKVPRGCDAP